MAKGKSEPQKTMDEPGEGATGTEAAATSGAQPAAAEAPKPARAKRVKAEAGEAAAKPARAKKPAAKKAAKPAAKKTAKKAGARDEDERDERDEDAERDDGDGDGAVEPAGDGDGDVIEVVGELVDEPALDADLDDEPAPRKARAPAGADNRNAAALSRTDPLQAYLREVQRHPLLTPEEEKNLTQHYYQTQDVKTAARLVTANLRLVVKLAYEYRRAYKNIMDLVQEGNIGLMQAVKRYDPYRGVKLSSYAAWWIRAYILRFIVNNWRLVKLGTTQAQRKLFFNLNKERAKLSAMGIEPTAAEIASRLDVDEKEVVDMDRRLSGGEASLDAPVGDAEGRPISRVELMPSPDAGVESLFASREVGELVHDHLERFRATLSGKDLEIFDKRMTADEPLTLQELGDEFGVSRERVRQLEARLTMRLREYLKDELGDAVGTA